MFGLSGVHLLIILIIVLVIFGPGKLPELGKSLGMAITEFKKGVGTKEDEEAKPPSDTPTLPKSE